MIQVKRQYRGGTLVITNVQQLGSEKTISAEDEALIAQYVQLLDEKNILGDIEVSFPEVREKFST